MEKKKHPKTPDDRPLLNNKKKNIPGRPVDTSFTPKTRGGKKNPKRNKRLIRFPSFH